MLRGTLAAAVTPLDGDRLDEDAFAPYVRFLAAGGLDGLLALGTTGEGLLFRLDERKRTLELFLAAAEGRLQVAAHCGAQTTADTVALAAHAAEAGADAVAVIGPPYFQLDERALLEHFSAAAAACAPTAFYVYEFERASGYAVPLDVLHALRERAPNLAGLKVSDAPFDRFSPYLIEGLDVFVGPEAPDQRVPWSCRQGPARRSARASRASSVRNEQSRDPGAARRADRDRQARGRAGERNGWTGGRRSGTREPPHHPGSL